MKRLLSILFLFCVYSHLYAQTPYDSFSPETSCPILDVVQNMDSYKDSLRQANLGTNLATKDNVSKWLSPDPLSDKYLEISPYAYCGWNPVKYIDPDGREWKDMDGNIIKDHSNIKAYIFYNKKDFNRQTNKMYSDLENTYGKGTVALSDVCTKEEFQQDWQNMASQEIREVNINHHGSNQAIHLDWQEKEYITSTGTGKTKSGIVAPNVSDLGTPMGNISNARLNLNTCHSNSTGSWLSNKISTSRGLMGTKETLMQSFWNHFNFNSIRGTAAGVSYNRRTLQPEPQFFFQSWTYFYKH